MINNSAAFSAVVDTYTDCVRMLTLHMSEQSYRGVNSSYLHTIKSYKELVRYILYMLYLPMVALQLQIRYSNTSPNSHATLSWIRVSENKNVTPISPPTPISNAIADSTRSGYHVLESSRRFDLTIISKHNLGTIIRAKMYPSVIHLNVSLTL